MDIVSKKWSVDLYFMSIAFSDESSTYQGPLKFANGAFYLF